MKWTTEQLSAINSRGGKIIVNAGAGSGKTAVLTNRIINYIINNGSINELLIVTFTNLAAVEMKTRIKKTIHEEITKDPNNIHLQEQAELIDEALIMTMDSFYTKLIKENFSSLKIKPNFKIIEEVEHNIIKNNILNKLIEEVILLEKYKVLFDNFSNFKNGITINEIIINFNNYLNKFPFPEKFLNNLINQYNKETFEESIWSPILNTNLLENILEIENLYLDFLTEIKLDDNLTKHLTKFLENELANIKELKTFESLQQLKNKLTTFKFIDYPRIKGYSDHPVSLKIKSARTIIKKIIKDYNDLINIDELILKEHLNIIKPLVEFTKLYRKNLEQIKLEKNVLSFDDIPHLVIKLLIKDYNYETKNITLNEIAFQIKEYFKEILIDEFQDTNLVQDLIFKSISKGNNLFIVGDAKQSIYGFRNAEPKLLIEEKNKATINSFPKLINLNKNFRSRKEILDFTNLIFSKTMKKNFGNIKYNKDESLNTGRAKDNNLIIPEINIINNNKDKTEQEAIFITNKIKELVNQNIKLSDIAILLRSPGEFTNTLRRYLKMANIDVYTDRSPIYFDNYEIKLIIAFLKIINDPTDEISLITVLRSPLFEIDENLLLKLRKINKENLFKNLNKINDLKLTNFLNIYNDILKKSKIYKTNKLINYIYNKTNFLNIINCLENGIDRIDNLLNMVNHAKEIDETLPNFIKFIDDLLDEDYSLEGSNPTPRTDSVLITTIHQSKGLEFPIVILPQLDKKFNLTDLYQNILYDDNYFLSFKIRDFKNFTIKQNIIYELIKINKKNKQLAEELRIFYVALTRAKEKLILSGTVNNISNTILKISSLIGNNETIPTFYLKRSNSFLDFLLPVIIKHNLGKELRENANIDLSLYNDPCNFNLNIIEPNDIKAITKETKKIKKVINNEQYKAYKPVIQKESLTVSEINNPFKTKLKPKFIEDNKGLIIGTIYHNILEHLPFIKYNNLNLEQELKKLNINEEINLNINKEKILNFFNTSFYQNIILKSKILKEYPITFLYNESVVEGIIDLLCEYNNEFYIIDYKSDITSEKELIKRYKTQINLYEQALKQQGITNIHKYIYSFNLNKFIKIK